MSDFNIIANTPKLRAFDVVGKDKRINNKDLQEILSKAGGDEVKAKLVLAVREEAAAQYKKGNYARAYRLEIAANKIEHTGLISSGHSSLTDYTTIFEDVVLISDIDRLSAYFRVKKDSICISGYEKPLIDKFLKTVNGRPAKLLNNTEIKEVKDVVEKLIKQFKHDLELFEASQKKIIA